MGQEAIEGRVSQPAVAALHAAVWGGGATRRAAVLWCGDHCGGFGNVGFLRAAVHNRSLPPAVAVLDVAQCMHATLLHQNNGLLLSGWLPWRGSVLRRRLCARMRWHACGSTHALVFSVWAWGNGAGVAHPSNNDAVVRARCVVSTVTVAMGGVASAHGLRRTHWAASTSPHRFSCACFPDPLFCYSAAAHAAWRRGLCTDVGRCFAVLPAAVYAALPERG